MEPLSALLLSNDAGVLGMTNKIFDDYGFDVNVVTTAAGADELLLRNFFDLAIYDNDVPGAMALAREKAPGGPRVVFALVRRNKALDIHGKRVHFVMQKPFTGDLFLKSLRAACGIIAQEKRMAFRCQVQIGATSAKLLDEHGQRTLHNVKVFNLSKNGLGLKTDGILPQGATVELNFPLPESNEPISLVGTVMWSRDNGQVGLQLTQIPAVHQRKYYAWIESKLPPDFELMPRPSLPPNARDTGMPMHVSPPEVRI